MIYFATPAHRMSKEREEHLQKTTAGLIGALGLDTATFGVIKDIPWIDCARADLVAQFMASSCDQLFFRDDDIDLTPDVFRRMLEKKRPIVLCPYKTRTPPHPWAVTRDPGGQITHAGLGCVLIQRQVIEDLYRHYGEELRYFQDDSHRVALFLHMIVPWGGKPILLKEDHAFFERVRAIGYRIDEVVGPISHGGIV
jgi:hypothetical protein